MDVLKIDDKFSMVFWEFPEESKHKPEMFIECGDWDLAIVHIEQAKEIVDFLIKNFKL